MREELSDVIDPTDLQVESEKSRVIEDNFSSIMEIVERRTSRFRRAIVLTMSGIGMGGFNVYRFMEHNEFSGPSVGLSIGLTAFAAGYAVYARGRAHLDMVDLYSKESDFLKDYYSK